MFTAPNIKMLYNSEVLYKHNASYNHTEIIIWLHLRNSPKGSLALDIEAIHHFD